MFQISRTTTVKVNNKVVVHNEEEIQKKYSKNMKIFDIFFCTFVMYCRTNCDYVLNLVFYFEFETIKWYSHKHHFHVCNRGHRNE